MPPLPKFEEARIPIEKLRDYALNPDHPVGRNKALLFRQFLGIERRHADALAELIRSSLPSARAERRESNAHGELWTSYHEIVGLGGRSAIVTVGWILRKDPDGAPEMTTCYIEPKAQGPRDRPASETG